MTETAQSIRFDGRILFLYDDPALIKRQLGGEDLPWDPALKRVDNISTDELTPGWVCYYYDETLARYCLVGLRGGKVGKDAIERLQVLKKELDQRKKELDAILGPAM